MLVNNEDGSYTFFPEIFFHPLSKQLFWLRLVEGTQDPDFNDTHREACATAMGGY